MLIIRGYLYMQSRDKIICAAMTLAIIAFMVLSPGYIVAHRQTLTQQYRQQSTESYQGIISLWHIVGFKSYQVVGKGRCDPRKEAQGSVFRGGKHDLLRL